MILYHASTVKIDEFRIPYGGLHVGGLHSALEAALRKLRSDKNVDDLQTVYVHKVHLNAPKTAYVEDLGDCQSWRKCIDSQPEDINALEYMNRYEPDVVSSYVVWDTSVLEIVSVDVMHMDEAEDIINSFHEEYDI